MKQAAISGSVIENGNNLKGGAGENKSKYENNQSENEKRKKCMASVANKAKNKIEGGEKRSISVWKINNLAYGNNENWKGNNNGK